MAMPINITWWDDRVNANYIALKEDSVRVLHMHMAAIMDAQCGPNSRKIKVKVISKVKQNGG